VETRFFSMKEANLHLRWHLSCQYDSDQQLNTL
jgi:hypothetical protein